MEALVRPLTLHPVNLIQIIYATICILGIVVVVHNRRINSLCILLLLAALLMVFNLLEETNPHGRIYLITPIFTLGFGPAFYWFCSQLVYNKHPEPRQIVIHLAPMLLALPFTYWPQIIIAIGSISQIGYLSYTMLLVKRYHQVIRHTNSNTEEYSIYWLLGVFLIFLLMMLQDLVRLNLQPFVNLKILQLWYFANTSIYTGLIGYLVLMAIQQRQFFNAFIEFEHLVDQPRPDKADEDARSLFLEIDRIIRKGQLYLQPRFSLRDLATETGVQEKNLSWAINQGAKKNFSEYINQLRIDDACQRLATGGSENILDLAYAVGFNSKSTFNAAFKKQTGLTPGQFRKMPIAT